MRVITPNVPIDHGQIFFHIIYLDKLNDRFFLKKLKSIEILLALLISQAVAVLFDLIAME